MRKNVSMKVVNTLSPTNTVSADTLQKFMKEKSHSNVIPVTTVALEKVF